MPRNPSKCSSQELTNQNCRKEQDGSVQYQLSERKREHRRYCRYYVLYRRIYTVGVNSFNTVRVSLENLRQVQPDGYEDQPRQAKRNRSPWLGIHFGFIAMIANSHIVIIAYHIKK